MEIVVRRDGTVGDVKILQGLDGGLNDRAVQAVFGGVVDATWKGPTAELHIEMHSPATGQGNTTQIPFRVIELTLTPTPGTTLEISSSHGECSFTVQDLSDTTFSGNFTCSGVTPTGSSTPIDVKGTFAGGS